MVISEQISAEQTKRYYCICLIKHCEKKADILICLKYRSAAAAEEKVFNQHFLGGSARRKTNINNNSSSRVCEADALELGF